MKYNQFSYIPPTNSDALKELKALGFSLDDQADHKHIFQQFLEQIYFHNPDKEAVFQQLIARFDLDFLSFLQSKEALTEDIFLTVSLQLLGFVPNVDFTDTSKFCQKIAFPVQFEAQGFLTSLHHLLASRTKQGMTLVDYLVSQGFLAADNRYHYFNGKSLATFDTSALTREIVYVEAPLDTDQDGQLDLIKVNIIRPKVDFPIPTMMTASPYHQGVNEPASDKRLHKMEGTLTTKAAEKTVVQETQPHFLDVQKSTLAESPATESFAHIDSYTLNDYFLARGFANIYVSGIGTLDSDGFMTSGDYAQVESFKAVIDWLNGRTNAYTSRKRQLQVKAHWASGLVATTGKSYLGTMSTGLATTGVEGLKVIIAESAISTWYDYYRENGLVCSPGGYPGEDLDVLTELTYSRNLAGGDYLRHHQDYQLKLEEQAAAIDRESGNYNQFWHDRNYLPHTDNIKAHLVFTHGLQDWNVKPSHVYKILKALPDTVKKHAFLHHGEHVYLNNWQSIDFRESMNALLCQELLELDNHYQLPDIIWQHNRHNQTWHALDTFGSESYQRLSLGSEKKIIDNHYPSETFKRYSQHYPTFKTELFTKKANQVTIDLDLTQDIFINGACKVHLKLKSSTNKGILSAQLLDYGKKKRLADLPSIIDLNAIDNGQNFVRESLKELPFKQQDYRVISKAILNLQHYKDLLSIEDITPNQWMSLTLTLQPSIYQLAKGDRLRLVLYTTDFEHTIRDNASYTLTLDLAHSYLELPHQNQ